MGLVVALHHLLTYLLRILPTLQPASSTRILPTLVLATLPPVQHNTHLWVAVVLSVAITFLHKFRCHKLHLNQILRLCRAVRFDHQRTTPQEEAIIRLLWRAMTATSSLLNQFEWIARAAVTLPLALPLWPPLPTPLRTIIMIFSTCSNTIIT